MIQVAIASPVSSATCERSFSSMRKINTYARANMDQDRFSNLAILNRDKDIVLEEILHTFARER